MVQVQAMDCAWKQSMTFQVGPIKKCPPCLISHALSSSTGVMQMLLEAKCGIWQSSENEEVRLLKLCLTKSLPLIRNTLLNLT